MFELNALLGIIYDSSETLKRTINNLIESLQLFAIWNSN